MKNQKKNIMYDTGHIYYEKILADFMKKQNYKVRVAPFTTNMGIVNDVLTNLGEFITRATFINHEGKIKSCKIVPSAHAIFIEDKIVRKL